MFCAGPDTVQAIVVIALFQALNACSKAPSTAVTGTRQADIKSDTAPGRPSSQARIRHRPVGRRPPPRRRRGRRPRQMRCRNIRPAWATDAVRTLDAAPRRKGRPQERSSRQGSRPSIHSPAAPHGPGPAGPRGPRRFPDRGSVFSPERLQNPPIPEVSAPRRARGRRRQRQRARPLAGPSAPRQGAHRQSGSTHCSSLPRRLPSAGRLAASQPALTTGSPDSTPGAGPPGRESARSGRPGRPSGASTRCLALLVRRRRPALLFGPQGRQMHQPPFGAVHQTPDARVVGVAELEILARQVLQALAAGR